jgi:hypothetical protein
MKKQQTWRDVLPVHPAAEVFPPMSDGELGLLAADIKTHGLRQKVVLYRDGDCRWYLLDGRSRLEALHRADVWFEVDSGVPSIAAEDPTVGIETISMNVSDVDPYGYVLSANVHRRHLTAAQKREVVAKVLQAQPEKSNRQIAKQAKVSDKTVGSKRAKLEGRTEIPHVEARTDSKGRKQPATKPKLAVVKDDQPVTKKPKSKDTTSRRAATQPEAAGSLFATWVKAKTAGVKQTISELATARPTDVDDEAAEALFALADAGRHLSKASRLTVRQSKASRPTVLHEEKR